MSKGRQRPTFFVCASISNKNELLIKPILSTSPTEASNIFAEQFGIVPQSILGPWFKKRTQVVESTRELKFTNQIKKAIYNDWVVNAFMLKEPENQAYLIFLKRVDDKKIPLPKGIVTVPISELKDI